MAEQTRQTLADWYKHAPRYPFSLSEPDAFVRYGESKDTLKPCAITMVRRTGDSWYALRIKGHDQVLFAHGNTFVYRGAAGGDPQ